MASRTQRRMRVFILTAGISATLFSVIFPGWARVAFKRDHNNAPVQQAVAPVVMTIPAAINPFQGTSEPENVLIRFHGGQHYPKKIIGFSQLHAGQDAKITYRIGRSGRVYIDSVEPLPVNGAARAQP